MEFFKNVYDDIKNEIEPYKPKMAKVLEFTFVPFIIAVVSIFTGSVASLIIRSFTDIRPTNNAAWIFWCFVITLAVYGLLHAVRAYQLYSRNGIMNDPKYVVVVSKHKDWILKASTGKVALRVALNTLIVSILFTIFDFDLKVQIGSWTSAIDSRAFTLAAIAIYCWSAWLEMFRAIRSWINCREHMYNRFGV